MKGGEIVNLTLTAKIRMLPNEEHQFLLLKTRKAYMDACNEVSDYIFSTHILNPAMLNQALYRSLREKYGLKSQMAQSVLRTVTARYKTILENQHEWIRPEFRHAELDLVWNRDYSLKAEVFSVNTLEGRVKFPFFSQGMESFFDGTWKFGTAKLVTKHGKWFLHIPMTKDIPEVSAAGISNIVGVDLGINFLAVSYDSQGKTKFFHGRHIKQKRAQYKKTRRSLQKKQTPSARRRLKKIGQREHRWMSDVNHQVSKALAAQNPSGSLFVLEDLTGIRQATEKVALKHRYETVSWSFYDLREKIRYKARRNHSAVILVDPKYTSQRCPKCGHIHKQNRNKKTHIFICRKCGYQSNDDRIGAMNLYRKGIEYLWSTVAAG